MTPLSMYRGDSATFLVEVVDADGDPMDLTSWTLRFTAKANETDSDAAAFIVRTTGDGIATTGTTGEARISLVPGNTLAFPPQRLLWDLQATDGSGTVRTLADGTLFIRHDISNTSP